MERLTVTVGDKLFTASLFDNKAVHVLKGKLPRTIEMKDLHANEKYYRFQESFPTNHRSIGSIETGDIMLFESGTIVIFYKSFRTPYSYTRIGKIEDTEGLVEALGEKIVAVSLGVSS